MLEFIPLHHVILPNAFLRSYELNTLDACWIAVDVWSNSSRCRIVLVYLSRTWCLYTLSCLDIVIIMHFSINCSTVICSPTVILMLSWEKPLVKPMAPESIFHHINFLSIYYFFRYLFCNLYFPIYIIKIPKIFILLSQSDLTFASGREGIDNPFIALVARFLFVCVGTRRLACSLLLDWYLGSQKLREILTLLCCITLSSSRENQRKCSRGSTRRHKKQAKKRRTEKDGE